jgi:non-canonical poly(A) RNA polymerase PAPD5/7
MTEAVTDYRVDISLNVTNGVKNCKTIKSYLARYPATRPLLLVIKQYLLQRSLNEVFSGGLGSYALIIMMISFLQVSNTEYMYMCKFKMNLTLIRCIH